MLSTILFIVVVVASVLWYRAKFVLKRHGFPISLIWHGTDLPNLYRLYQRETDQTQRASVFRLMVALYGSIAVLLLLLIVVAAMPKLSQ
jgi:hypothetical protein